MNIDARLEKNLQDLRASGADFTDIYFETSSSHSFSYEDGALEEVSSSGVEGTGVRVIRGESTSHVHTPGVNLEAAVSSLERAALSNGLAFKGTAAEGRALERGRFPEPPDVSFFREADALVRKSSSRVKQVSMSLQTACKNFAVYNSDGIFSGDRREYTLFGVEVVVEKDGVFQTGYESEALSADSGEFFQKISPIKVAEAALKRALLMLDAPLCPAGAMSVLLSGEAGGTMVHEACGHGLEADIVQKDFSVYRNKIGKAAASPLVTLVDDGSLPGLLGSGVCDDEGTPCRRNILIERGVLKGYLTDWISARKGSLALTGNGRRSSYRSTPQPRMTNTYIEPGDSSPEEMLRGMKKGLFVKKMGGGEVDPTSGDFVFQVTEGYLVKDGRIAHPVRGALLTGNGPDALFDIKAVGADLHFLPGICGKSGQSVPVSDGQPTLLIGSMVIGGAGA
ncbi:MAG: TldD/PmbA family protein [Aminivibrio sp.]|jgi:TldD protein|nr:TldD/PmbA family protein [Synergistaceae bacterium]